MPDLGNGARRQRWKWLRPLLVVLAVLIVAVVLVVLAPGMVCLFSQVSWGKPEVQAALITSAVLLVSILGSLIASYVTLVKDPRHLKALEFKLNYVERQMSDLYGPLSGLLASTQRAYYAALRAVGLSSAEIRSIRDGEAYLDSYQFFHPKWKDSRRGRAFIEICDKFFVPSNQELRSLIMKNYHLIGPEERYRPAVLKAFLSHEAEFRIRFERWKTKYEEDCGEGIEWPPTFEQEVEEKIQLLTLLQTHYRRQVQGDRPDAEDEARIASLLRQAELRYEAAQREAAEREAAEREAAQREAAERKAAQRQSGSPTLPPQRIILPDPPPPPSKH